jgi:excisionase family DNA binding protein
MTIDEAAATLGVARSSAYEAARRGDLPTLRIGQRLLVPRAALARMLGELPDRETADTEDAVGV